MGRQKRQVLALTRSLTPIFAIVSAERLELSTNGLKGHCSTIELRAHLSKEEGGLHSIMGKSHRQRNRWLNFSASRNYPEVKWLTLTSR